MYQRLGLRCVSEGDFIAWFAMALETRDHDKREKVIASYILRTFCADAVDNYCDAFVACRMCLKPEWSHASKKRALQKALRNDYED
jgi:hypothetical protein